MKTSYIIIILIIVVLVAYFFMLKKPAIDELVTASNPDYKPPEYGNGQPIPDRIQAQVNAFKRK